MMHSLALVIVMGVVTMILRVLPFLVFSNNTPAPILYLGKVLPYSIMAMLVVYCLRNIDFLSGSHGIAEVSATILVIVLHKWKHNTLFSILFGTLFYMFIVQVIL